MTGWPDQALGTRTLTDDERRVIHQRHFGWEKATPVLLASVFGVSVQRITAVLRVRPEQPFSIGGVPQ